MSTWSRVITVRHAKFDRMRPSPASVGRHRTARLRHDTPHRLCPTPSVDRFFVSVTGRALHRRDRRGLPASPRRSDCAPTPSTPAHDLRHAFAVHTLIDAHRSGADISAVLPVLSTYLGHVEPANTYWYLSAVPELMQLAAARLEPRDDGQP
jgi:integrase